MKKMMLGLLAVGAAMVANASELPMSDEYARDKAESILKKMTLEQKVTLCGGCATMYINAIPEVGIPREWGMSDCSHTMKPEHGRAEWPYVQGIDDRSTSLPPLSALAQTWNKDLALLHGKVMGEQNRARNKDMMLGPGVNIARTPLCGRNWEYMSEDPFFNAKMVVPLIKAVQKEGVATTVKHYCLNNQELARNSVDTVCDERTFNEIYLPAFEAAICEGGSLALMTSYNRINGQFASENGYTQRGIVRDRWHFPGMIVTDWGGAHSTVMAALNGGNVEMDRGAGIIHFTDFWHKDKVHPLLQAVKDGKVPEATVDEMALHVLWTMAKTGFLDGLQPQGQRLVQEHYDVCGKIGDEAIVLAKNDAGVLPLKKDEIKKVVFLGRAADMDQCHLGCSCEGHAPYEVTAFKGVKAALGDKAEVKLLPLGAESTLGDKPAQIDNLLLDTFTKKSTDAFVERAWEVRTWSDDNAWQGDGEITDYVTYPTGINRRAVRFQARVTAPESGNYLLGFAKNIGFGAATVKVDGKFIFNCQGNGDAVRVAFEKGRIYTITIDIGDCKENSFSFGWVLPSVLAAQTGSKEDDLRSADAVIVFTGTSMGVGPAREQEAGDRPNMKNPDGHDAEIAKLLKMNLKNLVIINRSCSPCELPWIDDAETVVLQPYLGQEAGNILARMLFGDVNPSGKLCLTWPRKYEDCGVAQCGTYNDKYVTYQERFYVGYRWYDAKGIKPLFPFGYGLSYTTFAYDQAKVECEGEQWKVSVRVTNTGKVAGKESVQFYMAPVDPKIERAVKELKGFAKTKLLKPGESEVLSATLTKRDFAYWDILCHQWRVDPGRYEILVGASSADIRGKGAVEIK